MPRGTQTHDTPNSTVASGAYAASYTTRTLRADSPTTLPSNYAGSYSAADLTTWPSGGILTTSTIEDLRKGTNQLAFDFNTSVVSHQNQLTKNDNDITEITSRQTEFENDLNAIAVDISNKAWDTITLLAGTGLTAGRIDDTNPDSLATDTVNLKDDFDINLLKATTSEIGGVLSTTT